MSFFDIFHFVNNHNKNMYKKDTSCREFELTNEEEKFVSALYYSLKENGISKIPTINMLSNGTLNFIIPNFGQIGRVKIRGRKTEMQIIKAIKGSTNVDVDWRENLTTEEMISLIPHWIEYLKYKIQEYKRLSTR